MRYGLYSSARIDDQSPFITMGSVNDGNERSNASGPSLGYVKGGDDSFFDTLDDGGGDSGLGFWMLLPLARCFPALKDTPYIHLTPCASHRVHDGLALEHLTLARLHESHEFLSFCPELGGLEGMVTALDW